MGIELNRKDFSDVGNPSHQHALFSTNFLYRFNKKNNLRVGFNRIIEYPDIWQIDPFPTMVNRNTFYKGNLYLEPEINNNLQVEYTFSFKDIYLSANPYFSYIDNAIINTYTIDTNNAFIESPININHRSYYGLLAVFSYDINSWWYLKTSCDIYNKKIQNRQMASVDYSLSSYFNLGKWSFGFEQELYTKSLTYDGYIKKPPMAVAFVDRTIINDNSYLSLTIMQPFWKYEVHTHNDNKIVSEDIHESINLISVYVTLNITFGSRIENKREIEIDPSRDSKL